MSCRPEEGGSPKCKLGTLECRRVEHRGHSMACILQAEHKRRCLGCAQREYSLFILTEAPKFDEDRAGFPFSGQSQVRVLEYLDKAGVDPLDVYITYQTKCVSPKGRTAARGEIAACSDYLQDELNWAKPNVVLLVGQKTLASFNLDKTGKLAAIRGNVFEKKYSKAKEDADPQYKCIPTVDPASFLYSPNPRLEARLVHDYILAWEEAQDTPLIRRAAAKFTDYRVAETVQDVDEICDQLLAAPMWSFDTEGFLDWWKNPNICYSFAWGEENACAVIPIYRHDPDGLDYKWRPAWNNDEKAHVYKRLREVFTRQTGLKVAHNFQYDLLVTRQNLGIEIEGKLVDTMILHWLLFEAPPHDLEYLADLEFATGDYSKEIRAICGHGKKLNKTYDWVPDHLLHPYAALDAQNAYRLALRYLQRLSPILSKLYWEEKEPMIMSLAEATWNGHRIYRDKTENLRAEFLKEKEDLLVKTRATTNNPTFNPSSPDQVRNALIALGLEEEIRNDTKVSGYSTDKITLSEMDVEIAQDILRYRTVTKWSGTYINKIINGMDHEDRIRFGFKIPATKTGRLSAELMHQIPRTEEERKKAGKLTIRDIFGVTNEWKYVYTDASMVELRVMAVLAKDEVMLQMFRDGVDVHKATAATALGIERDQVSKHNRSAIGKSINFGVIFGSKGYQISQKQLYEDYKTKKMLPIPLHQVEEFMAGFHSLYQGISAYIQDVPNLARLNNGVLVTPFGQHRRMAGELNAYNKYVRQHAEREAVNFIIQSTAGAMTNRSMCLIYQVVKELGLRHVIRFVNTVHDSLAFEVRANYVDWFCGLLKKICERPYPELDGYSFPWEIGVGDSWCEAEAKAA